MKKATKPHSPPSPDRHLPPLKATKSSTVGHVAFYQWIEEGEHDRQDFKETISSSRKIAKTLCAFANTRGGRLLVGVRDNGSLRHLDTEAEKQMLENAGSFFCKPEVALDFHPLQVGMKEVLVVEIHESQDKPVRCLNEENEWEVYIRSKDQCLLASEMSIRMLRNEDPQGEDAPVLEFGSKEQALLDYLRVKPRINVPQCKAMFNIGTVRARNMLLQLTRSGLLTLHSHEKEDFFTLGPGGNAGNESGRSVRSHP